MVTLVRRAAEAIVVLALVTVGIALVAGYVLGQPAAIAYVDSGSMEPTLEAGDGFVPIPAIVAGDVSEGDVVMFESQSIEGGSLTTHRVVEVTDQGYVTRGDANPFTDQDSGAPPVSDGDVVAVALQVNGEVVRLPKVGIAADAIGGIIGALQYRLSSTLGLDVFRGDRGLALLLFGTGVALLALDTLFGGDRRERTRSRRRRGTIDGRYVVGGLALLLMFAATLGMLAPAGVTTFELVSAESGADTPRVVEVGGTSERTYVSTNGGVLPVRVYLEPASSGVTVREQSFSLARGESRNVTVVTDAPDELGFYARSVREYRYLSILPEGLLDRLYRLHPLAPVLVIDGLVGGTVLCAGLGVARRGPVRLRTGHRSRSR